MSRASTPETDQFTFHTPRSRSSASSRRVHRVHRRLSTVRRRLDRATRCARAGFARRATRFRSRVDAFGPRNFVPFDVSGAPAAASRVAQARTPTRAVECRRVTFPRARRSIYLIRRHVHARRGVRDVRAHAARRASSWSASSASAPSPGSPRARRVRFDALDVRLADVSRALDAYAARARERDALGARGRLQPCVTYLGLRAEREYSIGAFVFDASQTMPLHNHPGMTVFMRALFGSATVTSYDLVSCVDASGGSVESHLSAANAMEGRGRAFDAKFAGRVRLAGGDGVSAASSSTIMLTPTRANVHTITAMTACAILEVQTPPYAVGHGRDCHYFEFVDTETEGMNRNFGDDGRRLREIGPSPSYVCRPFPSDDHEHSLAR